MATIYRLPGGRRINQALDEGAGASAGSSVELVSEKLLADLRGMIFANPDQNGGFKGLAEKAGVGETTILRLISMDQKGVQTKRPHFETVTRLLLALGRMDLLEAAFSSNHKSVAWGKKNKKK